MFNRYQVSISLTSKHIIYTARKLSIFNFVCFCIKVRKVKERRKKKKKKDRGQKEQWMKLLPHSEVSQDLDSKYGDQLLLEGGPYDPL